MLGVLSTVTDEVNKRNKFWRLVRPMLLACGMSKFVESVVSEFMDCLVYWDEMIDVRLI